MANVGSEPVVVRLLHNCRGRLMRSISDFQNNAFDFSDNGIKNCHHKFEFIHWHFFEKKKKNIGRSISKFKSIGCTIEACMFRHIMVVRSLYRYDYLLAVASFSKTTKPFTLSFFLPLYSSVRSVYTSHYSILWTSSSPVLLIFDHHLPCFLFSEHFYSWSLVALHSFYIRTQTHVYV